MSDITVYMLPVGQGAMNLITEYEDSKLVNLVLIDCGELRIGHRSEYDQLASNAAKEFVKLKMKERFAASDELVCLDFLLITHRDQDHVSFVKDLFKDRIALLLNKTMYYMKYDEDIYTDGYLLLTDRKEVECSRIFHMDAENSIFTAISRKVFTIDYKDTQTNFEARCMCDISYEVTIIYEYNNKRKTIFANSDYGNKMSVMVDFSRVYYIDIGTKYINQYDRLLNAFLTIFDKECADLSNKKEIGEMFKLLGRNTYKSYDQVLNDFVASKTCFKKPIARCFIGGNIKQSKGTVRLIRGLTQKEEKDFDPHRDIFDFRHSVGLRIIHYATINQMTTFFNQIGSSIDSPNNASSVVSLLHDLTNEDAFKVLFTGDATHQTFYMINSKKCVVDMLTNAIWTAPHHGSTKTLGEPIDEILKEANVKAVVISAGYKNGFGHPHGRFIQNFKNYFVSKGKTNALQYICYNYNDSANNPEWVCQPTLLPIYSTLTLNTFAAHIFVYSTQSHEVGYKSMSFSTVTKSYKRINKDDSYKSMDSQWSSYDVTIAENEKTKTAGADISLKKLFIIR